MLRAISALVLLAQALFPAAPAGVGATDAYARSSGNAKPVAAAIGRALFATVWPAQVLNVYADSVDGRSVAGLRLSGVRFHRPLTREQFIDEIAQIVRTAFTSSNVNEVDVWATVPLRVGKDVVVAGDLAKPTSRTVFTLSVRRGESADSMVARMRRGDGAFWDQEWMRSALK